jgi:hypothetical protein
VSRPEGSSAATVSDTRSVYRHAIYTPGTRRPRRRSRGHTVSGIRGLGPLTRVETGRVRGATGRRSRLGRREDRPGGAGSPAGSPWTRPPSGGDHHGKPVRTSGTGLSVSRRARPVTFRRPAGSHGVSGARPAMTGFASVLVSGNPRSARVARGEPAQGQGFHWFPPSCTLPRGGARLSRGYAGRRSRPWPLKRLLVRRPGAGQLRRPLPHALPAVHPSVSPW